MKKKFVKEKNLHQCLQRLILVCLSDSIELIVDYEHKDQQHRVEETGEKT